MNSPFASRGASKESAITLSDDEATPPPRNPEIKDRKDTVYLSDDETLDGDDEIDGGGGEEEDDDDDDDDDDDVVVPLTPREVRALQQQLLRGGNLAHGQRYRQSARAFKGFVVIPNMSVEFTDGDLSYFLYIKHIIEAAANDIILEGALLKRNRDIFPGISKHTGIPLHSILPLNKNDVCMSLQTTAGNAGSPFDDRCLTRIPLASVVAEKRIIFSDHDFPALSYLEEGVSIRYNGREYVEEHGVLVCRWKYVEEFDLKSKKITNRQILRLDSNECDKGKVRQAGSMLRNYGSRARTETKKAAGTKKSTLKSEFDNLTLKPGQPSNIKRKYEEIEEEEIQVLNSSVFYKRRSIVEEKITKSAKAGSASKYRPFKKTARDGQLADVSTSAHTFGDACAGMGVVTKAAADTGLDPRFVLDIWDIAMETLRKNFPRRKYPNILHLHQSIQDFAIGGVNFRFIVDVLHISFPCQGHSGLNRGQNPERDAENNVTLLCIVEILRRCRPRIVTLEQTNHILWKNEGTFARMVISQLTAAGYSTQWRVLCAADYGGPQPRNRLIVMAACPGQAMPQWPKPTHGPGLKSFVTFNEAIRNIPRNASWHDVAERKRRTPRKLPRADGNRPLRYLINTGGVGVRHPEGYYPTIRQIMRLQTIPDEVDLVGKSQGHLTTQVGNCVPWVLGRAIFSEIVETLKKTDREVEAWEQEATVVD